MSQFYTHVLYQVTLTETLELAAPYFCDHVGLAHHHLSSFVAGRVLRRHHLLLPAGFLLHSYHGPLWDAASAAADSAAAVGAKCCRNLARTPAASASRSASSSSLSWYWWGESQITDTSLQPQLFHLKCHDAHNAVKCQNISKLIFCVCVCSVGVGCLMAVNEQTSSSSRHLDDGIVNNLDDLATYVDNMALVGGAAHGASICGCWAWDGDTAFLLTFHPKKELVHGDHGDDSCDSCI